jgi:hypothetical protein
MQYWKKENSGKVERLEESEIKKHPEKLESLKNHGYIQIKSESDNTAYSKPKKQYFKKKKK